jgi:allantoate deiminase
MDTSKHEFGASTEATLDVIMISTKTDRAARVISRCREIAGHTEVPGEITRLFLTPPMHAVHALLREWMESAGMTVQVDAIGNLRGLWSGLSPRSPRLLIGSHLDTVPNAGAFDGILGVVLGVSIVEELRGQHLPYAIEVIGFSEEEGVRFSKPFLGSRALLGKLDPETLACRDRSGISILRAIQTFGLDPARLPEAIMNNVFAYFEIHIEQGPVLESEELSLGIVEAIVGQTRMQLVFSGHANHAGTTPMHLRHDAMAAAADWIVSVEGYANSHDGLVATVGKIEASPGVDNVIAGQVMASLDVRHPDNEARTTAVATLIQSAESAAAKRGVQVATLIQLEQSAVLLDSQLTTTLQDAATRTGIRSQRMMSGAGHDAMILAPNVPSTMLFLRSPGGLSHHPDESVLLEDVEAALATAVEFLQLLRDDEAKPKECNA